MNIGIEDIENRVKSYNEILDSKIDERNASIKRKAFMQVGITAACLAGYFIAKDVSGMNEQTLDIIRNIGIVINGTSIAFTIDKIRSLVTKNYLDKIDKKYNDRMGDFAINGIKNGGEVSEQTFESFKK